MFDDERVKTSEDNTNYKAIVCGHIPELFLDKIVAKKHFGKFGKIKRFILRPKRLSCTVEYENNEDAKNAYLNAGSFNGTEFFVNYAEHEEAHVQNTEEWVDPEVQAELEAMSPGHRFQTTLRAAPLQKSNVMSRIPKNANNLVFPLKSIKAVTVNYQSSNQSETSKFDGTVLQELEAILKTPAFTDEEKYRILDARDKLIRLTTIRQTDIKKAVTTKGSCPDMCPEKERLMREFQRQVSIFEMAEEENSESKISHRKAVKEYSRSSADQEVPLSHELRSESVLQMTMLYLVHRIIGLCDDPKTSLGDWFHFVWDRTRSIRKDITQQELCSLGAVQLVEQCARFHIHCAARLVAEDPSVFDKKINAENLTKCLQTLKYMYHDLRIKGVVCPREAEFRSYIILLNLGDSNFLWEVRQLPEFIQKSCEIKRAIAFYNALQSNNFVRFFSMIKSPDTSYMSACILLGYFTKLRVRAMDAIIKSHNWRKNDVYLPLSYLTNVLGFDDETTAISFFNHYGLQCDVAEKRVLLERLIKPNIDYAMDRALQLVESKRKVSVGECIFGQTLPPASLFEHHQPHSSFDDNGMLKMESLVADGYHFMQSDVKTNVQTKYQDVQADTNFSNNNMSLFKIPQNVSVISLKQQRKHLQQGQDTINEKQENSLDPLRIETEKKVLSSEGFRFCENVFSGTTATRPINESIFKTNIKPEKQTQNTIFHATEKPLTTMGNIFSHISTNTQSKANIFSTAVRDTANVLQQQKDVPKYIFGGDSSTKTALTASELKIKRDDALKKDLNKINVGKELEKNDKQIVEEEEKERNLELENLRNKLKQQEEYERQISELKIKIEEKANQTAELIIFSFVEEEVFKLAQTELFALQTITEASDIQNELLISEVVKVFVEDVANEEYALMCYDQLLLNRYFSRWMTHIRKKKEQRKILESTPLWITTNTTAEYAQAIRHPCQQNNMEMIKRYRFGRPRDLKMECDNLFREIKNPINLFALVGQHLLAKRNYSSSGLLQQRKYFKFLITIPENKEELLGFESFSNKWLMRLIEKSQIETGPFVHGIEHNVALCVRKLSGIVPKNEQGINVTTEGDHNDGVICFISGIEIDTHSRKRLYNLLQLTKNLKRVPLAIIAYNCDCNKIKLAELLGLDVLQEEGLVFSYLILGCQIKRRDFSIRELFIKAVDFITEESYLLNANEIQALAMQNVFSFIEIALGEEMWQKWGASANLNPIFNKICSLPKHVVGIYHKALDHLMHITQEDFDEMPEFPEELYEFVPENLLCNVPLGLEFFPVNWKDKTEKNHIKCFLQSLYLPDIEEKIPTDIEDLKLWILTYALKCIKEDDLAATKASHEAMTNLVNQINLLILQNIELSSCVRMINYLNILKPIVFAHINRMLIYFEKSLVNLKVIYLKDDLKNYQTQPWWLNYEPLNLITIDNSEIPLRLPQTPQPEKKPSLISTEGMEQIIAKAEDISRKAEKSISEFKHKKRSNCKNSFLHLSSISQLKRTLDDSLYQFELSKKVGLYDTSFVTDLTHDIDKSINKVINQTHLSTHKRKISCIKEPDEYSDIDNVIKKATKLIHAVESKIKVQKSSKLK